MGVALAAALGVLAACVALRLLDAFLIRSDAWPGAQPLTRIAGPGLRGIGFRHVGAGALDLGAGALDLGAGATLAASMAVLFLAPAALGAAPELRFAASAFSLDGPGEAGLMTRLAPGRANLVQAALFRLWHVVWPLRAALDGVMNPAAAALYGAGYVAVATAMGFSWGSFMLWFASPRPGIVAQAAMNVAHVAPALGGATVATVGPSKPPVSGVRRGGPADA